MRIRILRALLLLIAVASAPVVAASPGDPVDLESLRGKVVYVDFWASWCVPCRQSFPWMEEMHRRYSRDGLVVIAVNVDHERADAERFMAALAPSFRVAFDPEGSMAEHWHVRGMPTSFLIDREGKVQLQHAGFRTRDRDVLAEQIRTLLATH
jgi:thiol-disulfide isomerase/thioredoxin